jgi:hypothetical protein
LAVERDAGLTAGVGECGSVVGGQRCLGLRELLGLGTTGDRSPNRPGSLIKQARRRTEQAGNLRGRRTELQPLAA